jgi:ubiquinone/menaquinone biosynthesis C-methylase UbiE
VLAVDLSLTGLAYAERKTRELGCTNIEYGQADILKLSALGRSFDYHRQILYVAILVSRLQQRAAEASFG